MNIKIGANKDTLMYSSLLLASVSLFYYLFIKKRRNYTPIANVQKLKLYPVKSLPGVEVDSLSIEEVSRYGNYKDRQFILLDSNGNFISQRTCPSLSQIKLSLHNDNEIWFDAKDMPTLVVILKIVVDRSDRVISFNYRNVDMKAIDCGDAASEWFSNYLSKTGVKLVQFNDAFKLSPSRTRGAFSASFEKKYPIIFQDAVGLHVTNESSLANLNLRIDLDNQVSHDNFRSNIIIVGCPAYDEDNWLYANINDVHFRFVNPCSRCIFTTVNPKTGEKGEEPLRTLKQYRLATDEKQKKMFGDSPLFGIYLGPENHGTIRVNDVVFVEKRSK